MCRFFSCLSDGITWRLHQGKEAKVVFEMVDMTERHTSAAI